MKVALVVNRSAGALLGRSDAAEEIAGKLSASGFDVVDVFDGGSGDVVARMERARDSGAEAVVTAGGDGTVAAAAQLLAGTDIALAPLPFGTMNLLAKDLKLPLDLDAAIAAMADGEVRAIDVGEVSGHVFLCNSMLGLPSRLAERREKGREHMGALGWWRLVAAGLKGLYRYPPMRVGLDLGDGPVTLRSKAIVVANNAYDEGFGSVLTRSRLDGGELTLYATRRLSVWPLLRLSARMALGDWTRDADLETHQVPALTVTSRRRLLRVMNDGETMLLKPPLRYVIRPRALKVLAPRVADGAEPAPMLTENAAP
ncbi:diacylglycerol kinase family enzyme [Methylopila jiangsuensis]|uniref:diacylglycerol/lipid kinase family protein n=1 Tax=Methylopila jiangsuensis TaxID=586230 RepID=UPI0028656C1E|nr:diacylglycerol kinase family protein [Methylopila jiangsuensis]MDR6284692.1 diacylglycerol kinase family enzyme [Methylopila jiangsuensis]